VILIPEESRGIGEQVGRLEYGHFNDDVLNGSQPILSGYPDDMAEGTQWFEVNTIQQLTQRSVSYNIFTAAGQSGSPVFFRNGETEVACAIHNWGDDSFNRGVRINAEVVAQLDQWRVD
jgi:V8-like Glu-specific endopeptidase